MDDKQKELLLDVETDEGECCRCGDEARYELGDDNYCGKC